MKLYEVVVGIWGADTPRKFYFRNKDKAITCHNSYEHADNPVEFEAEDFPLDMLSDAFF